MKLSHAGLSVSVVFDEPNLMSLGGLVPVVRLAQDAGLRELADQHLSVSTNRGANAGLKVMSLVAGMVAGADSIDDMAVLRHGGMRRIFESVYAASTLGSFLREFRFGQVRQLDAVAARFLAGLARQAPTLAGTAGAGGYRFLDVDDTIIEVHGYSKQGSGYGYSGVRGLNALIATISTTQTAPVIEAGRWIRAKSRRWLSQAGRALRLCEEEDLQTWNRSWYRALHRWDSRWRPLRSAE